MNALAVLLTAATVAHAHAHDVNFSSVLDHTLSLFAKNEIPRRAIECTRNIGAVKCLSSFSAWRAERVLRGLDNGEVKVDLRDDLRNFRWEDYANTTDEVLESRLCEDTAALLQHRSLTLSLIPGYTFELQSRRNGSMSLDVYNGDADNGEARGKLKKFSKRFYAIVPFLLIPGLIMSAILPFFLPALKMATVGAGILNNMALTGAVFTLLRNNAFNDHYEKKIIYINDGYKNEKHARRKQRPKHVHQIIEDDDDIHTHTIDTNFDVNEYAGTNDFSRFEEMANEEWINQYYGNQYDYPQYNRRKITDQKPMPHERHPSEVS